jgi:hypothetical protein
MGNESLFEGADVVYAYTRKQAIEDGVLVDVSTVAKEAGIKYPVAVTRAVWDGIIEPDEIAKSHGESERGRLWDVLWMLRTAIKNISGDRLDYKVIATKDGRKHTRELKATCGPGDTPEPVITIMLPDED